MGCFHQNEMLFRLGVIPARYASTRFPGKPLVEISGKSMIQRVYEQAVQSVLLDDVIIATEHEAIYNHALSFSAKVFMTSPKHPSGTDRCLEAYREYARKYFDGTVQKTIIVNIQGDEPFIKPTSIDLLLSSFDEPSVEIATAAVYSENIAELQSPNTAKIVIDNNRNALYFSRFPIPFLKNIENNTQRTFLKHIGIYAYRADVLEKICLLPVSLLERSESLEQLRWLENGYKIKVNITDFETFSIDTPDDLEMLKDMIIKKMIH